jgi:hypothetical protein
LHKTALETSHFLKAIPTVAEKSVMSSNSEHIYIRYCCSLISTGVKQD